jgi:hypothetical protein
LRSRGESSGAAKEVDTDRDRYPRLKDVIADALNHEDFPSGQIERFEVTLLPSGEGTWRVWPARALEPEGGYYKNS